MGILRRLDAISDQLLAPQVATTSRRSEADPRVRDYTLIAGPTREGKVGVPEFEPAPEHPEIWAALAAIGNSNGVIDHTTPGVSTPANPQENP